MPLRPRRVLVTVLVLTGLAGAVLPATAAPPQVSPQRFGMNGADWSEPQASVDLPARDVVRDGMAHLSAGDPVRVLAIHDVGGHPEVTVTRVSGRAAAVRAVSAVQDDPNLVTVQVDRPRQVILEGAAAPAPATDGPATDGPATAGTEVASNDPLRSLQWGLDAIGAEQAWPTSRGDGVVVAILDTGVDGTHPDLGGRVLPGAAFPADSLGAGNVTLNPHGTHVAGIVGATADNGIGIAGVAPRVTILPVRIFNSAGSGNVSDIVSGIFYAADNGASVINMSYSAKDSSEAERVALAYARDRGVVLVAASGNAGSTSPTYPAAYPGVLAVGNLQASPLSTNLTSNSGTYLDLGAPGTQIPSTMPGNQYAAMSGTSMAVPHVTAVAAMLRARYPGLRPDQIDAVLVSTAKDVDAAGYDPKSGFGEVQAPAALNAAACVAAASCAAPTPALTTNLTQAYVQRVYLAMLGRPATGNDLWAWGQQLQSGLSGQSFTGAVVNSDEYRARFLVQTYQRYLGRVPSSADVSFWLGVMRSGATQTTVTAAVLGSPEYYQRAGGSDAAWVGRLYQDVLGRSASQADIDAWVGVLGRGASRDAVAAAFLTSEEYLTGQVSSSYLSLLGRQPSPAELAAALQTLRSTGRIEPVLVSVLSSPSFRTLSVQGFGSSGIGLSGHAP